MNAPCSFIWYELMTPDLDGAKAFYDAVVGWRFDGPGEQPGDDFYRMIMRGDGAAIAGAAGGALKLSAEMSAAGARPCWVAYLHTADVDAKVAEIVAEGGAQLMAVQDIPQGRFAMVTDPQGVAFYVMAPIPPEDAPDGVSRVFETNTPQHVSWNELMTTDLAAAKDFYARHFGFVFTGSMPMGELGEYCFFEQNGVAIGAMMQKPPSLPAPVWNTYIRVADIDHACAAIRAGGGQVIHGPQEVPGGDWSLNGVDPQGALFSLVGPKGT
jgi:predicted enzyme related to lactoylglutathione lyase